MVSGYGAVLRRFDISDLNLPTETLVKYLTANYSGRFQIHPKKYEDVVASIFEDFGCRIRCTAYSNDRGIDVFVFDKSDGVVGVQVKRYKDKIEAEQIRSFAGALIVNDLTKGIYVTTSSFTRGAVATADSLGRKGYKVELWDAEALLDRMQISRRPAYSGEYDESAPFRRVWKDPRGIHWVHWWESDGLCNERRI